MENSEDKPQDLIRLDGIDYIIGEWLSIKTYCEKFTYHFDTIVNWVNKGVIPKDCIVRVPSLGITLLRAKRYNPNKIVESPRVYRTAKGRKSEFQPINEIHIGITKGVELIKQNKGKFITALFIKKDGKERIINFKLVPENTFSDFGYMKVYDMIKMKADRNNCIRQINLQTLKKLKINGEYYSIDKK